MDYNNGNINNNMNMINPGAGNPPMGNPNMADPNMGRPPMGNPGMPNGGVPGQGMPGPGMAGPNMRPPMMGNPGMGNPNTGNPNMGRPPMGNPGMQNPGMGNLNMGRPGMQGPAGPLRAERIPSAPSHADMASSRLAREIEKSVNRESRIDNPGVKPTLRRAGGSGAGFTGFALPAGLLEGLSGFSPYIFGGILVLCLIVSLAAYGKDHKGGATGKRVSVPVDMLTYTGIFRNAYEAALAGNLSDAGSDQGVLYNDDGTEVPAAPTAIGEEVPAATDTAGSDEMTASDDTGLSEGSNSDASGSGSSGSYGQAESYKELLDQLEKAIASGDAAFVASKVAYEDESGTLKAFPQTVVEHFVTYMSSNTDKLSSLMTDLGSDKYSGQNDGEFIVKLPYIKFVVNMGYDNTTVSIPGFSEQVVNAGQSADIAPLMPCMYTLTISNPDWNDVVTRDIEANINESTISINIKP